MTGPIVKCPEHFVVPYLHSKCAMVFGAQQRHMTKAVNLGEETGCKKIGYFYATKEAMKSSELDVNKKRKV